MATQSSTVAALLAQLAGAGQLTTRKMFGEYCLYLDGTPVALVCNDQLYVKPTYAGRALDIHDAEEPPFPGTHPYLLISAERTDQRADREALCTLLRITLEALPPSKPRKPRSARRVNPTG